jgi:poly-gamma-glutamate capsule biosynthesis protein CapA/YwtB (metallophosphatase superfamily)
MSTRSTTHFVDGSSKPIAIVYRHSDGYPEGAGRDINSFLSQCAKLKDSRLDDASYLAAKYVVFLADMFNNRYEEQANGEYGYTQNLSKLDFISVGIMAGDPCDIRYRYVIDCGNLVKGKPTVTAYQVGECDTYTVVKIPRGKNK